MDRVIVDLDSVSKSEIESGDLVYALSGILEILAYVVTGVAFLVWLYRVRTNAEILSPDGHRRSRPWVILGWIVPVISLWFPKQIVDDIWYASSHAPSPSKAMLNAWWAVWISVTLAAQALSRLLFRAEPPGQAAWPPAQPQPEAGHRHRRIPPDQPPSGGYRGY